MNALGIHRGLYSGFGTLDGTLTTTGRPRGNPTYLLESYEHPNRLEIVEKSVSPALPMCSKEKKRRGRAGGLFSIQSAPQEIVTVSTSREKGNGA